MRPAIDAWAHEGNDAFETDVAQRIAAGEDPASARAYVNADVQRRLGKMLDEMRETDPRHAGELVTFMRRVCAEFGKPVPYPFA